MNKLITQSVLYHGKEISVNQLKENSNLSVIVECHHGQRTVRWCRRHQLCRQCVVEAGLYSTCKKGRVITWGDKISASKRGVKASDEHKIALSIAQYNCNKEDWPGFYAKSEIQKIRDSAEYLELRKLAFMRDSYKCKITGKSGHLEMHHIESMNVNLLKSLEIDNVVTLHTTVHKEFHKIYGNGDNTKEQFEEFIVHYSQDV